MSLSHVNSMVHESALRSDLHSSELNAAARLYNSGVVVPFSRLSPLFDGNVDVPAKFPQCISQLDNLTGELWFSLHMK